MIGIDTNILLRAILRDDPVQSRAADELVASLSAERPGYVNLVVLTELTLTLRRKAKATQQEVAAVVSALLRSPAYVIESAELVLEAVERAATGQGFNDALIGALNRHAGCMTTLTFDKGAPTDAGFSMVTKS